VLPHGTRVFGAILAMAFSDLPLVGFEFDKRLDVL